MTLFIGMVAGEASGDLLAGALLDGLRSRWPLARVAGIGGPQMASRGFEAWWPHDKLAVSGYVEVLRHYREIVGIRRQLRNRLGSPRPDLFIGVDAPDFNLDLEVDLRAHGVPTVHFVCPSIWAWRAHRVEKIRRAANHVLCLFPFEPELLARSDIEATYVGHPLASLIPMEPDRRAARTALAIDDGVQLVAILPGSRRVEVRQHARLFFDAAARMCVGRPMMRFVVPIASSMAQEVEQAARDAGVAQVLHIVVGQAHAALAACDVALVASGTATLEAALFKRPMVVAYRLNWLSYRLMWPQRLQPWVALPNILSGDFVVPELLQERATPQALSAAVLDWLGAPERISALQARFAVLHAQLRRDTSRLATDAIAKVLQA